jgi:hypothetical protein
VRLMARPLDALLVVAAVVPVATLAL